MPQNAQRPPHVATFNKTAKVFATFDTSLGTIVCQLHHDTCPITVGNFVSLAQGQRSNADSTQAKPFYDGTIFHRVIPEFMIQGGDPDGDGTGGPGYTFADEFAANRRHDKPGILSMANSGPNTNGSQFFITDAKTPWLDDRHTVFGEVTQGLEIVKKIAHAAVGAQDRPRQAIVLKSVKIDVQN